MPRFLPALLSILALASPARAGAIYPIDRATVLAGSRFDFKVEFDQVVPQDQIHVTVGGKPAEAVFGRRGLWLEREDGKSVTSWVLQGVSLSRPGPVEVVATGGGQTLKVQWDVYATGPRKAKNVILFIGDGLSPANRTAARLLSRGMEQGKFPGDGRGARAWPRSGRRSCSAARGRDRRSEEMSAGGASLSSVPSRPGI